jgi:hypothetical protein
VGDGGDVKGAALRIYFRYCPISSLHCRWIRTRTSARKLTRPVLASESFRGHRTAERNMLILSKFTPLYLQLFASYAHLITDIYFPLCAVGHETSALEADDGLSHPQIAFSLPENIHSLNLMPSRRPMTITTKQLLPCANQPFGRCAYFPDCGADNEGENESEA